MEVNKSGPSRSSHITTDFHQFWKICESCDGGQDNYKQAKQKSVSAYLSMGLRLRLVQLLQKRQKSKTQVSAGLTVDVAEQFACTPRPIERGGE